jgi:EmrB/QacA subfamily drug resistance transporter
MNSASNNKKWWVLIGVSIAGFLGCVDFTIVNTALPAIQAGLNASVTELQWIINIFILALSTWMVIMGRLADIYGRRLVLNVGMIFFGLASLGAGLANNIEVLIFFRLLQGTACAILYTASGAIVSNAFPSNERGKAMGMLFAANGVGLAVGPVLGGILVSALSWRYVFLINVPLIFLSIIICFAYVSESKSEEENQSIDWKGLAALIIALPCLILSVTQGNLWGWTSLPIVTLLIVSVLMFIVFYFIEQKAKSPIIEFHLFVNRTFIASVAATAALAFFYCTAFFMMPLYLHQIRGEDGYMLGLMLLPITATVTIMSPIVGKVVDMIGPKLPIVAGLALFASSAFLQSTFNEMSSLAVIITAFILMGIGWACILGPSTVAALSSVPESSSAVAMGSSWTLHNVGGAIGLALGLVVYQSQVSLIPGYHAVMELLIVSSLTAMLIVIFGMNKR